MKLKDLIYLVDIQRVPVIINYRQDGQTWYHYAVRSIDSDRIRDILEREIKSISIRQKYSFADDDIVPHLLISLKD